MSSGEDESCHFTLKDWFLMGGYSHANRNDDDVTVTKTNRNDVSTAINSDNKKSIRKPFHRKISRILLLDGGVSTHLEEKIKRKRVSCMDSKNQTPVDEYVFQYPELWSSSLLLNEEGREEAYNGHIDWIQQGNVNVISTVTYQSHYVAKLWPTCKCKAASDDQQAVISNDIMDRMWYDAIRLAKQAITDSCCTRGTTTSVQPLFVVASSGCYGAALSNGAEYTGLYQTDDKMTVETLKTTIYDFHVQKLATILGTNSGPVDGIAIETVPSIMECEVLSELFRSNNFEFLDTACYVSLSCRNGSQLNDGSLLSDALRVFHDVPEDKLQAIGLNCCSVNYIPDLLRVLIDDIIQYTPHRGIVVFPNSGESWDGAAKEWVSDTDILSREDALSAANKLMTCIVYEIDKVWDEIHHSNPKLISGRRKPSLLIGGCCRTTVETIAALRISIDEYVTTTE